MPSMTSFQAGELVLVDFPFTASGPSKPRPALVILDTGDADVLLARVTTQPHSGSYDVPLAGWQHAGLLAPSIVRLHKLATLAKTRVRKRLGTLDAPDRQSIAAALRQITAAW
jgi:mRNA-degrading endonuclease toxin of MazEF toxin-antitoxin module